MIFNGTISGSGFTHVPGGEKFKSKSVFSFHYYCWWFGNDGEYNKQTCDRMFGPKVFDQVAEDVRVLGGSSMLTEWGQGCDPDTGLIEECNAIFDLADEHFMSWASWYYFDSQEIGNVSDKTIEVYSRTYAQRIAGIPTKMKYDYESHDFDLCFNVNPTISEPTEIYANFALHYANGVNVSVQGSAANDIKVLISPESNMITLLYAPVSEGVKNFESLSSCIRVTPK
jgi:endoglycosylceramidase